MTYVSSSNVHRSTRTTPLAFSCQDHHSRYSVEPKTSVQSDAFGNILPRVVRSDVLARMKALKGDIDESLVAALDRYKRHFDKYAGVLSKFEASQHVYINEVLRSTVASDVKRVAIASTNVLMPRVHGP